MTPRPLKVLYVSDSSTVSGAEVVLLNLLDEFRPPSFQSHVFLRANNHRLQHALETRRVPYTMSNTMARTPIRTTVNPRHLADFATAIVRTGRTLAKLIREHQIDVVHTTMYPATIYVAVASRLTGCPQIWHEHGIKRIHRVNKPIYRFVSRTCSHVIGPSNAVTQPLLDAGIDPAKVRTVYNGIDLASFDRARTSAAATRHDLGLTEGARAVALFGQMLPHKGHRTLIEAAPAILERFPNTRFFFIGALENQPYQDALLSELRQAGLESRFVFTGWRSDVPAHMAAMDVIVVPTLTPEPAALSLMEAMAMERPLIAARTGGTAELVLHGETGLLFAPGDSTALANLINTVLADQALAARLGQAGRRRMLGSFSSSRHFAEIAELFSTCTREPSLLTPA